MRDQRLIMPAQCAHFAMRRTRSAREEDVNGNVYETPDRRAMHT